MIKVSVILPIYNGEATLSNTLDSLVAQTFKDFEVIACIDGTTDKSESILKDYALKFKKLSILHNTINRGLGPTMNRLVYNASGTYIAVAEQDDYYYPERLQLQVDVLDKNLEIGLVSGIAEFKSGDQVHGQFPGLLVHGKQYPRGVDMFLLNYKYHIKVVNSCMMFRKSVHVENGLYFTQHYPSISVDWTYVLRFSLLSNIHGIHNVLVGLDRRSDRDSVTSNKQKQFKATRELLRAFAYEYPDIINKEVYNYAMRSQYVLEISSKSGISYIMTWLFYFIKYPFEKRYIASIKKRLLQKL
ncbi:glycosyltransferase family 2 protein [Winogradskyella bathintestinalis]|uniref:Glycosyltransferase family 2 protein n=1 Tax=Winogradskyella bathintestinalis TaxID=3035208 RepID=A0ABT7ZTX6_9FLAO|nr:glycosyltransferase family 2 protein [Winogradskyella bathintestinalis]MDN3492419.1 glycosyltransferase family 2 protein [Winogradskyella bathintestinalis]